MGKYLQYFKIGYSIMMAYRSQVVFGTLRHLVVVLMSVILWAAIYQHQKFVAGYDFRAIVTYYILVEIIDIFYQTISARVLTRDINSGDLANYLVKPLNYWTYLLCYSFGSQVGYVSMALVVLGGMFMLFPAWFFVQTQIFYIFSTILIILFSAVLYFQIFYIVGCLTFWLSESSHFRSAVKQLIGVLGGRWVPLVFFPNAIVTILNYTPFPILFNFIVSNYQGKLTPWVSLNYFARELVWIGILILVARVLWQKGVRNFNGYGK